MLDLERAFWLTVLAGGIVAALTLLGIASSGFVGRSIWPRLRTPHGRAGGAVARGARGRRPGDDARGAAPLGRGRPPTSPPRRRSGFDHVGRHRRGTWVLDVSPRSV